MSHQPYIDKIHLHAKDPYKAKYQLLIKKHEGIGLKHCNNFIAFIEYSNMFQDIYKNIDVGQSSSLNSTFKHTELI